MDRKEILRGNVIRAEIVDSPSYGKTLVELTHVAGIKRPWRVYFNHRFLSSTADEARADRTYAACIKHKYPVLAR